jgi:hypothetical protein
MLCESSEGYIMMYTDVRYSYSGRKRRKPKAKGVACVKFKSSEFKELKSTNDYINSRLKELNSIPSFIPSKPEGIAAKQDRKEYTGSYIIGIATMHKSNAIPITNGEQAIDIAKMRR